MPQIESFSCSDPDGSNKTVVSRDTVPGTWKIAAAAAITEAELHGVSAAIGDALSQPLTGGRYAKVFDTFAGPDVTYAPNAEADPNDDTVMVGSLPVWSRAKAQDFQAGVSAYVPAP